VAFTENPKIFLAEFGVDATLTPLSGAAKATRGLFEGDVATGAGMDSSAPTIRVPSVDVPANITHGAAVIAGVTYRIDRPEPDGTGWTTLVLEKA
jgi:hypothetical protein